MTSQPDELAPGSEPGRQDAARHAAVALRSIGQPNSVAGEFDFWDDKYEGRRLFSELLGTFFLVLVAVGGGRSAPGSAATRSRTGRRWWPRR
jgi:aquaporin Z